MFAVSKRNIILPGPNGEKFQMAKDYMGALPAWAKDSAYLKALAEDGKVIISDSGRDKDIDAAGKKRKKASKAPKEDDSIGENQETPDFSGEENQEDS